MLVNQTQYDDFLNFMVEMTDRADEISMKYFKEQQLLDVSVKENMEERLTNLKLL